MKGQLIRMTPFYGAIHVSPMTLSNSRLRYMFDYLREHSLDSDSQLLLTWLCAVADETSSNTINMSKPQLMGLTNLSAVRLNKALKSLEVNNLISRIVGGGRTVSQYSLNVEYLGGSQFAPPHNSRGVENAPPVDLRGGQNVGGSQFTPSEIVPPLGTKEGVSDNENFPYITNTNTNNNNLININTKKGKAKNTSQTVLDNIVDTSIYRPVIEKIRTMPDYNLTSKEEQGIILYLNGREEDPDIALDCAISFHNEIYSHWNKKREVFEWCYTQSSTGQKAGYHQTLDGTFKNWVRRHIPVQRKKVKQAKQETAQRATRYR